MGGRMRLDHAALMVSDPEAARAFYVEVLGLEEVPRPPTFTFPGLWLKIGDHQLHLVGEAEPGRTRATHPGYAPNELATGYASHFALEVDELESFVEQVRARGGAIVGGPRPRGDGVLQAYVADPDGNVIELMQTGVPVTGDEPEIGTPAS
jgi:catechol 2,3-dioxygenase-like lactoylglutathione lyase family enzyme